MYTSDRSTTLLSKYFSLLTTLSNLLSTDTSFYPTLTYSILLHSMYIFFCSFLLPLQMEFLKVSASPISPDIWRKLVIREEENNKQGKNKKKFRRNRDNAGSRRKIKRKRPTIIITIIMTIAQNWGMKIFHWWNRNKILY